MSKAIICDIDGTIADLSHRLHFIKNGKRDWGNFFANVGMDKPYWDTVNLIRALNENYEVLFVSGRPEKTRVATERWMIEEGVWGSPIIFMRKDDDHRSDTIVKSEILDNLLMRYEIVGVIDDRPSVVKMWRDRGLTCYQCREWNEVSDKPKGLLTLMVGPSGAGKSHWLVNTEAPYKDFKIRQSEVISSDQIRSYLCGDYKDQSKNDDVFAALHAVVQTRIDNGLPTVVDATNIRNKDRTTLVKMANGGHVRYIVIDRLLMLKRQDGGWRNELNGFDLIGKHDATFKSNIKDILIGDGYANVTVHDLREYVIR